MSTSRYIRARVVDFTHPAFAGEEVAGKRRRSAKDRQIRAKLKKARRLKMRISRLKIRKPLGWKGAVKKGKTELRVVMSDLKHLGWKPKKPTRDRRPGEDEMDAMLDDIPEPEPGESDELPDEEVEELPDAPETEGERNWLDQHVGATPPKRPKVNLFKQAGKVFAPKWTKAVPLGDGAQIKTRPGQRAMVATVSPGLFIVQLVSDQAAQKLAGDNVGVLPLVLYPLVKQRIQQKMAPQPSPAQLATAQPAAPAATGCDDCRKGGSS